MASMDTTILYCIQKFNTPLHHASDSAYCIADNPLVERFNIQEKPCEVRSGNSDSRIGVYGYGHATNKMESLANTEKYFVNEVNI